jgi:hypothetical protein
VIHQALSLAGREWIRHICQKRKKVCDGQRRIKTPRINAMQKPRYEGTGGQGEAKDKERARRPEKNYANVAKGEKKATGNNYDSSGKSENRPIRNRCD